MHGARIGPLQPGRDHQQGRFARAGRADEANRLTAAYMQIDVLEDMHPAGAAAERQVHAGEPDRRRNRGFVHAAFLAPAHSSRPVIWEAGGSGPVMAARRHGPCARHNVDHGGRRRRAPGADRRARRFAQRRFRPWGGGRAAGQARTRAEGQGAFGPDRECRRVRRYRGGRTGPARLVGARTGPMP